MDPDNPGYPAGPHPDTFLEDPSTSDSAFENSLPSAPPSPPLLLHPSNKRRIVVHQGTHYSGPATPPLIPHHKDHAGVLTEHETREFLRLTSTLTAENARPRPSDLDGAGSQFPHDASFHKLNVAEHARPVSIQASGSGKLVYHASPRSSSILTVSDRNAKFDQMHEFQSPPVPASTTRISAWSDSCDDGDQADLYSPGNDTGTHIRQRSVSAPALRRVKVIPPVIDTSYVCSMPDDIVRTPYPFVHKPRLSSRSPETSLPPLRESVLTLTLRRRSDRPVSRVSRLAIPTEPQDPVDVKAASGTDTSEVLADLDFDDEQFFRRLQVEYRILSGLWRLFSARGLTHIAVIQSSACSRCQNPYTVGCGHLIDPRPVRALRSPRFLASQDLTDAFSINELLKNCRDPPRAQKGQYAWVQWARRLAETGKLPSPPIGLESPPQPHLSTMRVHRHSRTVPKVDHVNPSSRCGHPAESRALASLGGLESPNSNPIEHQFAAGIEFIEGWRWSRIGAGLTAVVFLAVAGMLLWTFLGLGALPHGGFRDAAGKLETAVLLGGFVLSIGWTALVGWLIVSWLVE